MRCKKHPRYKAKRKPRLACMGCWCLYLTFNGFHYSTGLTCEMKSPKR